MVEIFIFVILLVRYKFIVIMLDDNRFVLMDRMRLKKVLIGKFIVKIVFRIS